MRVLYVLRSATYFSYHEPVIRHLCRNGQRVEALLAPEIGERYSGAAMQACLADVKGLTIGRLIPRNDRWRWFLFSSRELLSYSSYLNRKDQSEFYLKRWQRYLPSRIRRVVSRSKPVNSLLAVGLTQSFLRTFERLVPPDTSITRWLQENRPDVVVVSPTNMHYSEETEYVKAAKAVGIPTVVSVLSWDNLTTKGLIHIHPDLTLAWNQTHFKEAMEIHRIRSNKMVITGAPLFDKWFQAEHLGIERKAFCRRVGLPPERPFVAYLGSSVNIARDETWLVRELARCLRTHQNPDIRRMNILIRPHPANARVYQQFKETQVCVWPKEGALPDSEESKRDFYNTLRYCVATVGINTTGMIDAVIADKPCVTIMTEYYRATQSQAVHFQHLLDADVLEIAKTAEECADVIEMLWKGADVKQKARRQFVLDFVRPHGLHRPTGEIAARAIELLAMGKNAAQIDAEIRTAELVAE